MTQSQFKSLSRTPTLRTCTVKFLILLAKANYFIVSELKYSYLGQYPVYDAKVFEKCKL